MTREEFLDLLDRYISNQCSQQERLYFDNFFNAFQKDGSYWQQWELTEKERIKIEIYTALNKAIDEEERQMKQPRRTLFMPFVRVAASVSLLAVAGWVTYALLRFQPAPVMRTEATSRGQRATVTLSDGSVIKLNAVSAVTFPEKFTGDTREISLTGEAFLDVHKDPDHPFIIRTGTLRTTVLGTSFNIRAHKEEGRIEVTVKTGRVKVADAEHAHNTVLLTPGEQARYDTATGSMEKHTISLEQSLAWTSNIIYLDNTPMREVVAILERWYNVKITLENKALGDCLISGKYKSDYMLNILNSLKFMQGIDHRFASEREIILSGKNCN